MSEAFEVAERLVDDRRSMLLKTVLIFKISVTIFANPVGQLKGRELRFGFRFVDLVRQMVVKSLLVNEIAVTIAAVELGCVNGRLQMLAKCFWVDEQSIALSAIAMSCRFLMLLERF